MYIRFVSTAPVAGMSARAGFLNAAYALLRDPNLDAVTSERLQTLLDWFNANLPAPDRLNRSKSKGFYRRETKGLSWFKPDAHEAIGKCREMIAILEDHGRPVEMIRTDRVGYIVYEDDHQVVAEPFSDTPV